jgi:hypothetical protein
LHEYLIESEPLALGIELKVVLELSPVPRAHEGFP